MSNTCIKHIEEAWKIKTETANEFFNQGKFKSSEEIYQEALVRAEVLNNNLMQAKSIGTPVLQIFAISCNNLANTYEKMEKAEEGEKMLKRVIYYLLLQSNNKKLNSQEVQNELKRAMINYTDFADRHNIEMQNTQKVFADIREQITRE